MKLIVIIEPLQSINERREKYGGSVNIIHSLNRKTAAGRDHGF